MIHTQFKGLKVQHELLFLLVGMCLIMEGKKENKAIKGLIEPKSKNVQTVFKGALKSK